MFDSYLKQLSPESRAAQVCMLLADGLHHVRDGSQVDGAVDVLVNEFHHFPEVSIHTRFVDMRVWKLRSV